MTKLKRLAVGDKLKLVGKDSEVIVQVVEITRKSLPENCVAMIVIERVE